MSASPWLWFIAGPNGAGKSTSRLVLEVEQEVRPDTIALQMSPSNPESVALKAGREAVKRAREFLANRNSFAIETTLAGRKYLQMAEFAKAKGWRIGLIYIGLTSPELAIERVRQRREQGGHDVRPADVRRRYSRSLANAAAFAKFADRAIYFDNSGKSLVRLLETRGTRTIFKRKRRPAWLRHALVAKGVS